MKFNKHLISIITPVHNCEKFIAQTIISVQKQTLSNWEMILIDDCSNDNSIKIIEEYLKLDKRIILLKNNENLGPGITRNKGIRVAKGSFITFLDGDDIWFPNFLETSLNFCLENNYQFVFASYERRDESLNPKLSDFIVPPKINYSSLLKSCPISCLTAFIDLRKIGKLYMPAIDKRQDWGLWLAFLKKIDFAYGIQEPLAIYRIRKKSVSRNKFALIPYVWIIYRDVAKLNIFHSTYLIFIWAVNGFIKYYVKN